MKITGLKVAHFVRGFLRPTETFIGNQIATLQRYEPVVFCHHQIHGHSFPSINVTALTEMLSPVQQTLQKSLYKLSRGITPFAAAQLADAVKHSDAKILHFHYLVEARFFLPVCRRLKLPSVVSGYGWDVSLFPRTKLGYGYYYIQPIFREMNLFLAMSDDMKKDIVKLGCPDEKVLVHYHGIDVGRFAYPTRTYEQKSPLTILFCGRLAHKKAPQMLLLALRHLQQDGRNTPEWRVTFVGDGPLRPELEQMVEHYGWKTKVEFKGHIAYHSEELLKEYRNADIYALPSITVSGEKEGIPGTLVEAMASGLPCVSTYHAGIPYVIDDHRDGMLAREGDIASLAEALHGLLRDRSLRESIGRSASHRALTTLDLHQKTMELEKIYDTLLSSATGGTARIIRL
jgi:colanic acid/amylovoran biosynthesis glycosyltransferase